MKTITLLVALLSLVNIHGQSWINYTSADGLIEGIPSSLIQADDGKIWFSDWTLSTSPGIGNFDGTTWETIGMTDDGVPSNAINDVFQDDLGNFWFVTFDDVGVVNYDGTTWNIYTTEDGLVNNDMWEVFQDSEGNMWFTGFGISKFDGTNWTNFSVIDGQSFVADTMLEDANGDFWFASSLGLLKYDGVDWRVFTTADGFSSDRPGALFYDSNNNLWVASYLQGGGFDKFDGTTVTTYSFSDGISNIDVRYSNAMNEDSDGKIYIGTNFGIAVFDGSDWSSISLADGLPEEHIRGIVIDDQEKFWISTFAGLSKYDPTLGIFETLKEAFSFYPNPASSSVQLKTDAIINRVEIYSLLGNKVAEQTQRGLKKIDISQLASGTYLVKVVDANNLVGIQKLVVE
ncbi:MAG: T9SS type A sorting domain-containing protein [Bacteroidetes bacterium]|nr:T9SS type A sorting domain-containing protein [Bacteroidota bacterium]